MSNTFCIIPIGINNAYILRAVNEAVNYFEDNVGTLDFVDIPKNAHNKARDQYRATSFLKIAENGTGKKNIAITNVDIYASRVNFVFGQAFLNGKACVISTHRLDPQFYANDGCNDGIDDVSNLQIFIERIKKESIHEIGHTLGLHHCGKTDCVMSFSSGIEGVDAKNMEFCEDCSGLLGKIL
ncbi:MAG: archaemetzincin family Zn-dependent metalloprotease [Methanosarcinaceae archaeon]|nr:archaemetzincin family Zn-dependent metalloprotease [Methanosarcinaceae archaeon]